jgi:hypothetical protein
MVSVRRNVSYGFLALYALYGLFGIGMTGLLFSFAIGLIALSMDQPIELTVAITILAGLFYKVINDRRRKEGFQGDGGLTNVPVGTGDNAVAIQKKIQEITKSNAFEPTGVLSSSFAEGFESPNATTTERDTNAPPTANAADATTPIAAESTPASAVGTPGVSAEMAAALPTATAVTETAPPAQPTATETAEQKKTTQDVQAANTTTKTSGFTDKATSGMFKLGSIPADVVGGAHIDVGTTLTNALNSLKPDQVKAMTDDTRKLLETQKSLMGMLQSMKPMLNDGKQLMETFGEMFGKQ